MKPVRGMKRSRKGSGLGVRIEGLESRKLLASVQLGNSLIFDNTDATNGTELWISDLDGSNAALVKDIRPGASGSAPQELFVFDEMVYFSAQNGSPGLGRELWVTDGTEAGTVLVKDIYQHGSSSNPHDFMVVNNRLLFLAAPSGIADQLYVTDGTTAGTIKLFAQTFPILLKNLNIGDDGLLHWDANDDPANRDLHWVTDGTLDGTHRVYGQIDAGLLHIQGTGLDDIITISSAAGVTTLLVNGEIETFDEADFDSILVEGLSGEDRIDLSAGPNKPATIQGGDDDDTLIGGAGNDLLDGGADSDTLDYSGVTQAMSVRNKTVTIGSVVDSYANAEGLLCGSGDDSVTIQTNNSNQVPSDPIRYIDGGDGNDSLTFHESGVLVSNPGPAPTVHGGDGDDSLSVDRAGSSQNGTAGLAYYFGDAGNDTFRMFRSLADRHFNGGSGIDTVHYGNFSTAGGLSITLDDQANDGPAGTDNVHSDVEIVYGSPWADTIVGSDNADTLFGGSSNDILIGGDGDDSLSGGSGDDTLEGGAGADFLAGGVEDDTYVSDPNDTVYDPASELVGSTLVVEGTDAANVIQLRLKPGNPTTLQSIVDGNTTEFALSAVEDIRINAYHGNDTITLDSAITIGAEINAGDGDDRVTGGGGSDGIQGWDGTDTVISNGGEDSIQNAEAIYQQGPGGVLTSLVGKILRIAGTSANDVIRIQPSSSPSILALAINGAIRKYFLAEINLIQVDALGGHDRVDIDSSITLPSKLYGNVGNDTFMGGAGIDRIYGGDGNDWMSGGLGNDTMYGEAGNDRMFGGDGRDYLDGGAGADVLRGEAGQDRIVAKAGEDDFRGNVGDVLNLL